MGAEAGLVDPTDPADGRRQGRGDDEIVVDVAVACGEPRGKEHAADGVDPAGGAERPGFRIPVAGEDPGALQGGDDGREVGE